MLVKVLAEMLLLLTVIGPVKVRMLVPPMMTLLLLRITAFGIDVPAMADRVPAISVMILPTPPRCYRASAPAAEHGAAADLQNAAAQRDGAGRPGAGVGQVANAGARGARLVLFLMLTVKPPVPMMGLLSVVVLPLLLRTIPFAEPNGAVPPARAVAPVVGVDQGAAGQGQREVTLADGAAVAASRGSMVLPGEVTLAQPSLTVSPAARPDRRA